MWFPPERQATALSRRPEGVKPRAQGACPGPDTARGQAILKVVRRNPAAFDERPAA